MALARSRVTSQGQISVPADVRRKLGVGPGSILEWAEKGDEVVVRKAGRYTFLDIHRALFPKGLPKGAPKVLSPEAMKEGIERYIRERHARGRY